MNYKSSQLPGQNKFDHQLTLNQFRLHNQDLKLQINKQVKKCDDPRFSVPFPQQQGAFLGDPVQVLQNLYLWYLWEEWKQPHKPSGEKRKCCEGGDKVGEVQQRSRMSESEISTVFPEMEINPWFQKATEKNTVVFERNGLNKLPNNIPMFIT